MPTRSATALTILGMLLATCAMAFTGALPNGQVVDTRPPPPSPPTLSELKGVVSWTTLADVRSVKKADKIVTDFSDKTKALDKTQVKIQGFMIPLEGGASQKRFLLSAATTSCEFCLPGGPETLVEVQSDDAVKYTTEPIVMSGKFAVANGGDDGVLYRLLNARVAP